jgi:hypothetical protein
VAGLQLLWLSCPKVFFQNKKGMDVVITVAYGNTNYIHISPFSISITKYVGLGNL